MTIGERIRKFRKDKNYTQKQLGEKCGIDEANIRKYELGKANPKLETIRKIANALEVYTYDLLYDDVIANEKKQQDLAECAMNFISEGDLEFPDNSEVANTILLRNFNRLNKLGKTEAFKRIKELTEIKRYTEDNQNESESNT